MPEDAPQFDLDPRYADLVVECPNPGHRDGQAMPLGEFLQTPRGQKYGAVVLENIANAEEMMGEGVDADKALRISFGGALQRDSEGNLLRASEQAEIKPQEQSLDKSFDQSEPEVPLRGPKGFRLSQAQ